MRFVKVPRCFSTVQTEWTSLQRNDFEGAVQSSTIVSRKVLKYGVFVQRLGNLLSHPQRSWNRYQRGPRQLTSQMGRTPETSFVSEYVDVCFPKFRNKREELGPICPSINFQLLVCRRIPKKRSCLSRLGGAHMCPEPKPHDSCPKHDRDSRHGRQT